MSRPSLEQLKRALTIAEQIAALQAEMASLMGGKSQATPAAPKKAGNKKGGISAAGRARIAAAQKARWAKIKGGKASVAKKAPAAARKKRKFSPQVRAKLAAAMRARWAAAKAGKAPAPNA